MLLIDCLNREFLTAIIGLALSTSLFLTVGILFLVDYYSNSLGVINEVTIKRGSRAEDWKPILMAIFTGIAGIFCFLILKLIIFHLYLIKNGLSTYEYIIRQREVENRKQKARRNKEKKVSPSPIQSQKNCKANSI